MALVLDGNGTMTVGNGDITGLATGALPSTVIGAGAILQVINAVYTGETTTTSGGWVDTGLTASITPFFQTSKILVIVHQSGISNNAANAGVKIRLERSGTVLAQFENSAAYEANGDAAVGGSGINYLDSPSTTSSLTYKTTFGRGAGNAGTAKVNHYGVSSGITLMEIAG